MLKNAFFFLIVFLGLRLNAQTPTLLLMSDDSLWKSKSMMAFLGGDGAIASNAVDVEFMRKSLLGGYIERNHIDGLLNNMPDYSRAGYAANAELELYNFRDTLFGKPSLGLRAAVSTNYDGYIGFQPNAFEVVYRGNDNDPAETVNLGPLSTQSQAWQKFGFGLFNKKTLSSITLSLVEGQSFQSLQVDDARLFTSSLGDSLHLNLAGNYLRSDTTRNGWANGSGIGACIDLDYNMPLKNEEGVVSLSIRNLGFVAWNDYSEQYELDTDLNWEGIDVSSWLDADSDSLALPEWSDSLNAKRVQSTLWKPLPASIQLRYLRKWKGKHFWETGVSFSPNRASVPQVYAGLSHALGGGLWISERVSYGGYGGFAVGVDVQWLSKSSWFVKLGAVQAEGYILPMSGGRSFNFRLGKNF